MTHIYISLTDQATSRLVEIGDNIMESSIGKAFSTDEHGSIFRNCAVNGNYAFFSDLQIIAHGVEKDRIMEALCYMRLTMEETTRWKKLVDTLIINADTEYEELLNFQSVFLGDFATKQNGCFKKVNKLLETSSFTIKKCMDILNEFTQKPKYLNQRRMIAGEKREWTLSHNILATETPQAHLDFMYNTFTPEAQELIQTLKLLMDKVEKLMDLCCQTLELEAQIKSDLIQLNIIHDRQFDSIKSKLYPMIQNIQAYSIDEMSTLRKNTSWEEFLIKAYHTFTDNVMMKYTVYQIIMESKKKNIDNDFEKAYLLDDDIKRSRIRHVIENFDDMNPKGKAGKLSSFYLAALYKWSGINCGKKEFYNYFWSIYKGKYTRVSYQQFSNKACNMFRKGRQYTQFEEDMKINGFYI